MDEEPDEKAHWLTQTPADRIAAAELLRQIAYGCDPTTGRLLKILGTVEREAG